MKWVSAEDASGAEVNEGDGSGAVEAPPSLYHVAFFLSDSKNKDHEGGDCGTQGSIHDHDHEHKAAGTFLADRLSSRQAHGYCVF